jgi:solute carrier family 25 phosphate transporter 23/24/25/41
MVPPQAQSTQSKPGPEPELSTSTSPPSPPPAEKLTARDQFFATVSQPVVAAFCAGGIAGAVSRTVVSPLERLKILFQIQSAGRDAYKLSVGKGLAKMWKEEGWRGFMRGNGTNCIRIVPYSAVQFGSYNFYKRVRNQPSGFRNVRLVMESSLTLLP